MITDTEEFVAVLLDPTKADEGMLSPGDVEGEISQFLKIRNRYFSESESLTS